MNDDMLILDGNGLIKLPEEYRKKMQKQESTCRSDSDTAEDESYEHVIYDDTTSDNYGEIHENLKYVIWAFNNYMHEYSDIWICSKISDNAEDAASGDTENPCIFLFTSTKNLLSKITKPEASKSHYNYYPNDESSIRIRIVERDDERFFIECFRNSQMTCEYEVRVPTEEGRKYYYAWKWKNKKLKCSKETLLTQIFYSATYSRSPHYSSLRVIYFCGVHDDPYWPTLQC